MKQKNLFNINTFRDYLNDLGIAASRQSLLVQGVEALHHALAQMDYKNLRIVKEEGLNQLLLAYAQLTKSAVIDLEGGKHNGHAF